MTDQKTIKQSAGSSIKTQPYDLEERTLRFAKSCIDICQQTEKNRVNLPLIDQLIRSSSSIGANYREAAQTLTKKEFYYRMNISRKEAKESQFWLELLLHANRDGLKGAEPLISEASQLTKIFSSIILRA